MPASRPRLRLLLCAALALLAWGCVERELVVECEPAAEIYVDGERRGEAGPGAPLRIPFEDYGARQVTARAAGYAPARQAVELDPPWYQVFPLGLVSDVLWPGTIHDEHHLSLRLERRPPPGDAAALVSAARVFAAGEPAPPSEQAGSE